MKVSAQTAGLRSMQNAFGTFYEAPHYPFPIAKYLAIVSVCSLLYFLSTIVSARWARTIRMGYILGIVAIVGTFQLIPDGTAALNDFAWRRANYQTVQGMGTVDLSRYGGRGGIRTDISINIWRRNFSFALKGAPALQMPRQGLIRVTYWTIPSLFPTPIVLRAEEAVQSAGN